jgi:hypothetical protein
MEESEHPDDLTSMNNSDITRFGKTSTQPFNTKLNSNISPVDDYDNYNKRSKKNKKSLITLNAVRVPASYQKKVNTSIRNSQ